MEALAAGDECDLGLARAFGGDGVGVAETDAARGLALDVEFDAGHVDAVGAEGVDDDQEEDEGGDGDDDPEAGEDEAGEVAEVEGAFVGVLGAVNAGLVVHRMRCIHAGLVVQGTGQKVPLGASVRKPSIERTPSMKRRVAEVPTKRTSPGCTTMSASSAEAMRTRST